MDEIAFLEMFPCCEGAERSYGNLHDAVVLEAKVNRERMDMTVRARFSAMPAPAQLPTLERLIAGEYGLR